MNLVGKMMRNFASLVDLSTPLALIFSRIGRENANVLPDPVLSFAIMSSPAKSAWNVLYWIGKSSLIPFFLRISMVLGFLMKLRRYPGLFFSKSSSMVC